MKLYQYRVDFLPEIEHNGVKKALVRVHENIIGKYVFDGTLLYAKTSLKTVLYIYIIRFNLILSYCFVAYGAVFQPPIR